MSSLYRTLLDQLAQISGSNVYSDTLSMAGAQTAPDLTLEKDLNFIRTQLKTITGAPSWYSAPASTIATLQTDVSGLQTDVGKLVHNGAISGSLNNIFSFTGMTDRNDPNPTYSSTNYVAQGSSLETAIGALDAAVTGVSVTKAITRVASLTTSGSAITLPNALTYTLSHPGGQSMDVYLNGQLMQANTGSEIRDYLEASPTTIKFTFNVKKNSYVSYLIRS